MTITDLPEVAHERLRSEARRHGRSVEEEARALIEEAMLDASIQLTEAMRLREALYGQATAEEIRDMPSRVPPEERERRLAALLAISAHQLAENPPLTDADLYDEFGLPA